MTRKFRVLCFVLVWFLLGTFRCSSTICWKEGFISLKCFCIIKRNQWTLLGYFCVLLFYWSVCVPHSLDYPGYIPGLGIRKCGFSHFITLFYNCLATPSFAFPYKFKNNLVYIYRNLPGIFIGIILNLDINLGRTDFFNMLSLWFMITVNLSIF